MATSGEKLCFDAGKNGFLKSCHRLFCGALIQICSLPTRCPPRRGALDMCGTARISMLEHNTCIQSISTMLPRNPGRSVASAQFCAFCHGFWFLFCYAATQLANQLQHLTPFFFSFGFESTQLARQLQDFLVWYPRS